MELIFAAACCSVIISILLKLAKAKGFDALQMIVWNYASASLLCFLWFKPDLQHISILNTPWWLIVALGVLLPSIFLCLAKSLQYAGIIKTEIAQRLSVVLSLLAAFFIFQEQFNTVKIIGIALGIAAVISILLSHQTETGQPSSKQAMLYLALVWFGYALIDVLLKYTTGLGVQFAVALNLMFICAFILSLTYIAITTKTAGSQKNMLAGLGLGALNFANIALYVKAHILLKDTPAIVFAGMNILVVLFGAFSGLIIFKEKLKLATAAGLLLGVTSVLCLAYAISA
ncbi:DMT family transporter [Acinetobacter sp. ANC 4779]|uniref:DMT family transporter n=1 Tax=Acinetobacter sp. ANC 4779 TaxID=2529848 RepID=UPI00103EE1AC|nr:DMT family transporter [Acinetobacter sp. ANC 4779]TCB48837.1 DMT family transporter [Acinetobacter sp. ANC 4779]